MLCDRSLSHKDLPCMSHLKLSFNFQQMFGKEIIKKLFSKYQLTTSVYTFSILEKVYSPYFIREVTGIEVC